MSQLATLLPYVAFAAIALLYFQRERVTVRRERRWATIVAAQNALIKALLDEKKAAAISGGTYAAAGNPDAGNVLSAQPAPPLRHALAA